MSVTVRSAQGLDMVQLQGSGLTPGATYTAYPRHGEERLPLLSFTADATSAVPPALAFVRFLGVYDIASVEVRPR